MYNLLFNLIPFTANIRLLKNLDTLHMCLGNYSLEVNVLTSITNMLYFCIRCSQTVGPPGGGVVGPLGGKREFFYEVHIYLEQNMDAIKIYILL
jgi:hypothetical protein